MAFTIKKRRRARDRWKNPQRVKDIASRLAETHIDIERTDGMAENIVSLDDMETQTYTHTAKLPKEAEPIGCVMIVLAQDPKTGRTGAMISGAPSMDYFVMQDILDAGDKMLKNLIRHTNPPKQDLSHIVVPTPGEVSALKRG